MAKKKFFIYNQHTLSYERVFRSTKEKVATVLGHFVVSVALGTLFFIVLNLWVESPQEKLRKKEVDFLMAQNELQARRLDEAFKVLSSLADRDNNIYRIMLQAEPIDRDYNPEYSKRYDIFNGMTNGELAKSNAQRIDQLHKLLYIQSKSYDELLSLYNRNEERLLCVPAIQPVSNKDLKATASGYGNRIDPIYRTLKFHAGMDFSAKIGTPIYATGDGKVVSAGWDQGYGKCVVVRHGFNYETLYAHMSDIKVKVGKAVKRGEIIGLVGNTGKSTGPHLHYEVHYKGRPVNPQHYYYMDLTPEDFAKMVEISSNQGQVFD